MKKGKKKVGSGKSTDSKKKTEAATGKGRKRKSESSGKQKIPTAKRVENILPKNPLAKRYKSQKPDMQGGSTSPGVTTRTSVRNSPAGKSPSSGKLKIPTAKRYKSQKPEVGEKWVPNTPKAKKKLIVTRKSAEISTQASTNIVADKDKGKKLVTPQGMSNVKFSTVEGRSSNVMTSASTPKQVQEDVLGSY